MLRAARGQIWPSRSLVWVDRQGKEEPIRAPARGCQSRFSPDGTRIAMEIRTGSRPSIWDLRRKHMQRVSAGPFVERNPLWAPTVGWRLFQPRRCT